MNVFEDLIEELKEENLIEETVIDTHQKDSQAEKSKQEAPALNPVSHEEISPAVLTKAPEIAHPQKETSPTQNAGESFLKSEGADIKVPYNENDFYRRRA